MTYGGSLAHYSTRSLLGMLNSCRKIMGEWYDPHDQEYGYPLGLGVDIPVADIKTELAGREHVPNKAERRAIRQARAKQRH